MSSNSIKHVTPHKPFHTGTSTNESGERTKRHTKRSFCVSSETLDEWFSPYTDGESNLLWSWGPGPTPRSDLCPRSLDDEESKDPSDQLFGPNETLVFGLTRKGSDVSGQTWVHITLTEVGHEHLYRHKLGIGSPRVS